MIDTHTAWLDQSIDLFNNKQYILSSVVDDWFSHYLASHVAMNNDDSSPVIKQEMDIQMVVCECRSRQQ